MHGTDVSESIERAGAFQPKNWNTNSHTGGRNYVLMSANVAKHTITVSLSDGPNCACSHLFLGVMS